MRRILNIWRPYTAALERGLSEVADATANGESRDVGEVRTATVAEYDAVRVARALDKRRSEATYLEELIEGYTEHLRQTRISIAAFEQAHKVLTDER